MPAYWVCTPIRRIGVSVELRERLGIDDIILILQQNRLQWYGHVLGECLFWYWLTRVVPVKRP